MAHIDVNLGFRGYVEIDGIIWFSNSFFNGLFTFDTNTGYIQFVHRFACENESPWLHTEIHYFQGELVFSPAMSNKVIFYNIEEQKETYVKLPFVHFGTTASFIKNGKLWLVSNIIVNGIWTVDLYSKECSRERISDYVAENCQGAVNICVSVQDRKMIVTYVNTNFFLEWDIDRGDFRLNTVEMENLKLGQVVFDKTQYWLLQIDNCDVYAWNRQTGKWIRYQALQPQWVVGEHKWPYYNIIFARNRIILINYMLKDVMEICKEDRTIKKAFAYPADWKYYHHKGAGIHCRGIWKDNQIFLYPEEGSMLLQYDLDSQKVTGYELKINVSESQLMGIISRQMEQGILYEDSGAVLLKNYLQISTNRKHMSLDSHVGENIYKLVKTKCGKQ